MVAAGGSESSGGSPVGGRGPDPGAGGATAAAGGAPVGGSPGDGGSTSSAAPRAELSGDTWCQLLTDCCKQAPNCFEVDMINEGTCRAALWGHMSRMECGPLLQGSITVTLDSEQGQRNYACDLSDPPRGFVNGTDDMAVGYIAETDSLRIDCSTEVLGEGALRIEFPAQLGEQASAAQIAIGSASGIDWYRGEDGKDGASLITTVTSHDAPNRRFKGSFSGQFTQTVSGGEKPASANVTFDVQFPEYPVVN
jgi:hypothetical protein